MIKARSRNFSKSTHQLRFHEGSVPPPASPVLLAPLAPLDSLLRPGLDKELPGIDKKIKVLWIMANYRRARRYETNLFRISCLE